MAVFTTADRGRTRRRHPPGAAGQRQSGRGRRPPRHRAALCVVWHDPFPQAERYLFALVGGVLGVVKDSFVTMSGRKVALEISARRARQGEPRRLCHGRRPSAPCGGTEQAFGREYDLDIFMIVAVSYFNMGAMENKGLNIFNDKNVLASRRPRPTPISTASRRSSPTNISTTGPATPDHLPRLVPALPQAKA